MLSPADQYFLKQAEPAASCLQYLRTLILSLNDNITEQWSYGMPFYYVSGKRFCYLWIHKKQQQAYIGFTEGHQLKFFTAVIRHLSSVIYTTTSQTSCPGNPP